MKFIATLLVTIISCSISFSQVMEQIELKDGSVQYYFTLDKYQKSFNYPIEVTHLGGDITKMKANTKSNLKGVITFTDLAGNVLYEKKMDSTLVFEFNTDKKVVNIQFVLNGYSPYTKKLEVEKLSILVLKLQPEPQEAIYVLNSPTTFSDAKLEEIMQCVNNQVVAHPEQTIFSTCEKIYKAKISVQ